jgi:DNA-binding HxlR family transcriptional regulator
MTEHEQQHEHSEEACDANVWRAATEPSRAVRETLDRIADKWTLIVISCLGPRELRFSELRREIPAISQRMLTVTLRGMERDGIADRHIRAVMPPHVSYSLTVLGRDLMMAVLPIMDWARDHQQEIDDVRTAYDEHQVATERGDEQRVPITAAPR